MTSSSSSPHGGGGGGSGGGGNVGGNMDNKKDTTSTINIDTKTNPVQVEEEADEWIFSMQLPRRCVVFDDASTVAAGTGAGGGGGPSKKRHKPHVIEMRQSQPRQPPLYNCSSRNAAAAASSSVPPLNRDSMGNSNNDDDKQQDEERKSLLSSSSSSPGANTSSSTEKSTTSATRTGSAATAAGSTTTTGWTLTSPYWSIQSDIVLQVTFRPAWQGMPEFTNAAAGGTCSRLAAAACCGKCCCGDDNDSSSSKIDFMTHTWTIHDIVAVREMSDCHTAGTAGGSSSIAGIVGSCRAIEVELKPLMMDEHDEVFSVPPLLRPAWERHVHDLLTTRNQASTATTTRQQQQRTTTRSTSAVSSTSSASSSNFDPEITTRHSNTDTTTTSRSNSNKNETHEATTSSTSTIKGPTLIFCLPRHQVDPPLLWKVHFPPLTRTAIAMETITVLEGSLLLFMNEGRQRQNQPPKPPTTGQQQQQQQQHQTTPSSATVVAAAATSSPLRQSSDALTTTAAASPTTSSFAPTNTVNNTSSSSSSPPRPTHIYITGYQSWSFAGSVARGCKQPTSALPKVFSRAFNLGGTPPPTTSSSSTSTTPTTAPQQQDGSDAVAAAAAALVDEDGNVQARNNNEDKDDDWEDEDLALPPVSAYDQKRKTKDAAFYQSDFFTCITSDGGQHPDQLADNDKESRFRRGTTTNGTKHLDERGGPAVLLGWLAQHEQFGVITADKSLQRFAMHASTHGQVILPQSLTVGKKAFGLTTDWAYVQLISPHSYDEEPMVHYLHSVAAYNQARPLQNGPLLTGWCSWYHYYENISESNLRENFAKLAAMRTKVPTNVAVVDDGYMTAWGDWDSLKPQRFSNTLEIVSRDIQSQGMRPGLWLAPFAADKHSRLVQEHPDWIIRNDRGIPANSSYCGKFFYGLDATNPAVRQYVFECIRRAVHDWKFNVLKIDFLYAACLHGNGKYDMSMSRAQAMHLALQTIRHAAGPGVFLIGCGCPIAAGIGYVDGMRISADTGPTWKPAPPLPSWDNSTLPCLRSMVRNSLSRAPLGHRWWHNDPDCLLLGESTRLSDEEVATAASIVAMTCGMMLLSDDLTRVSLARMRILTKIFPMAGATAVVLDLHSSASEGLPSLLRLWCSDKYNLVDSFRESFASDGGGGVSTHSNDRDHNAEATFFARAASFQFDVDEITSPNERKRSCIHVTKGLGTWTVVSISNWSDKAAVVHVPELALLPPPSCGFDGDETDSFLDTTANVHDKGCNGYHVFAFWSAKYSWLPDQTNDANGNISGDNVDELDCSADYSLSKRLAPHETEIFHIKPVTPDRPQYIGSDLHFSCGQEVRSFRATSHSMQICLKTDYNRVGQIFVFVPRIHTDSSSVQVTVNGKPGRYVAVGNTPSFQGGSARSPRLAGRVLRIFVVVHADGSLTDGQVSVEF